MALSIGWIDIQWISVKKTNYTIRWIVIYPVDNVIHLLNNTAPTLNCAGFKTKHATEMKKIVNKYKLISPYAC